MKSRWYASQSKPPALGWYGWNPPPPKPPPPKPPPPPSRRSDATGLRDPRLFLIRLDPGRLGCSMGTPRYGSIIRAPPGGGPPRSSSSSSSSPAYRPKRSCMGSALGTLGPASMMSITDCRPAPPWANCWPYDTGAGALCWTGALFWCSRWLWT